VRKGYKRYQDLPRLPARTPDPYRDFEHLERLPMNEFSERRVSQLRAEKAECEEKLGQLRRTEGKDLWLRELAQFEERWRKWLRQREQLLLESQRRAENFRRQEPSEPSPARNHRPAIEFEDISLDSQACADLEVSRT
jgi:lysozyme family protein